MKQGDLFPNVEKTKKSYRAIRHDVIRSLQKDNDARTHHPEAKTRQIKRVLNGRKFDEKFKILELFSGRGNCSKVFESFGSVDKYDKKYERTGDSFLQFHRLIFEKQLYDVIDVDPYGFPNRFFPDIYLLIEKGFLFVTMPKPHVNIKNGIIQTHLIAYYGTAKPNFQHIVYKIAEFGLCHWRKVELIDSIDLGRLWRMVFFVEKVKATEYTDTKNR